MQIYITWDFISGFQVHNKNNIFKLKFEKL